MPRREHDSIEAVLSQYGYEKLRSEWDNMFGSDFCAKYNLGKDTARSYFGCAPGCNLRQKTYADKKELKRRQELVKTGEMNKTVHTFEYIFTHKACIQLPFTNMKQ